MTWSKPTIDNSLKREKFGVPTKFKREERRFGFIKDGPHCIDFNSSVSKLY